MTLREAVLLAIAHGQTARHEIVKFLSDRMMRTPGDARRLDGTEVVETLASLAIQEGLVRMSLVANRPSDWRLTPAGERAVDEIKRTMRRPRQSGSSTSSG